MSKTGHPKANVLHTSEQFQTQENYGAFCCVDIGHGPFSHIFEEVADEILQEYRSQGGVCVMEKWTVSHNHCIKYGALFLALWNGFTIVPLQHELISCKVFDAIYKKRQSDFQHYGLKPEDIDFVREQLEGRDTISGGNLKVP